MQYEYNALKMKKITDAELNKLGEQGWELVNFIRVGPQSADGDGFGLIFKRVKGLIPSL